MEQHPIPQNISGFEFKLIGDITLKQFGYLAGGLVTAYLSTKIPLVPGLFRWPLAGICALLGFGLAFVPIEDRPLDRWLIAFVKSVYMPTQFVWQKSNPPPAGLDSTITTATPAVQEVTVQPPPPKKLAHEYTGSLPTATPSATHLSTPAPMSTVTPVAPPPAPPKTPAPPPPPPPLRVDAPPPQKKPDWWTIGAPPPRRQKNEPVSNQPLPNPSITGKRVVFEEKKDENGKITKTPIPSQQSQKQVERIKSDYEQTTQKLNQQIQSLQQELAQGTVAKERLQEVQQVLSQLTADKDRLSKELAQMRHQLEISKQTPTVRPTEYATGPSAPTKSTVKIVAPNTAPQLGIPTLTTQPNVVTGIIKDSKGMLLPNLIIMVKDKDSVPVRALKTNRLGQFAASTPLSNGVFYIEVEDPKNQFQFNRIEVSLDGHVIPPLEISAISARDVNRQKLAQQIFGTNAV